ncbi:activator-dependent family glycosyltransferase [Streptomyces cyaneofuscatus]|uniref:activator-dependent family glycosyltransferase n=1 Tax=Streptomyces cyaneofuscatus TaxID=66883 RepID=UPI0033B06698
MRVLLTSFAMDAHYNGMVPLAWALRTAGHDVRVASHPALTHSITAAGLTAVPVGRDHAMDKVMRAAGRQIFMLHRDPDFLENRPESLGLDFHKGHDAVMTATFYSRINNDSMVDDLVSFARNWRPELVLWEPFTFAGAIAARAAGSAHARLLSFPDLFLSTRRSYLRKLGQEPPELQDDVLRSWLTWTAGRFGEEFGEDLVSGQWSVDQMPDSVRLPLGGPTVPMRYIPYNGPLPAVVPDWLRTPPDRPRVCLTLGMTIRRSEFPNAVDVGDVLDACADLDAEVVATLDASELEGVSSIPPNTRLVEHVPLHALLPSCSAVVHHGGAGTWATAMAHGVPQLALGWMWDAIYRAQRLEELGAGLHLHSEGLSADVLGDRLLRLLKEPSFAAGAERLRLENVSAPSPNDVVPVLERLTMEHRPSG